VRAERRANLSGASSASGRHWLSRKPGRTGANFFFWIPAWWRHGTVLLTAGADGWTGANRIAGELLVLMMQYTERGFTLEGTWNGVRLDGGEGEPAKPKDVSRSPFYVLVKLVVSGEGDGQGKAALGDKQSKS
jgi:hypothetical protein